MIVFRLSKTKFAKDLSGKGAEKSGGRWNSKGVAMLYTSESRALCTTEIAVHTALGNIPFDYCLTGIEIPDNIVVFAINIADLAPEWKDFPHYNFTQKIGDGFVENKEYLVLKVPSAVVQGDYNYLINPAHPDFRLIKIIDIEPFSFDERLFK
jgi:RES domain-containing protein